MSDNKKPKSLEVERRRLTVMFCDLVGSTTLSEKIDPEELRELILIYRELCAEVIERFDGYIAQYLGDGVLAYFGYPSAHEDDAKRAVHAGLCIVEGIRHYNTKFDSKEQLDVRVGIHTGLVVVGGMGEEDKHGTLALGETPNIAARLKDVAEPNSIIVSESTYKLVEGFFICQSLGSKSLKGFSRLLELYSVLQKSDIESPLDIAAAKGLTPLVGRSDEIKFLLEHWEGVKKGEGHVILLNGEAGIGKSRIVDVLKEQLTPEFYTRIESRCSPYHQNTPFYPIITLLEHALRFKREDSTQSKLEKLEDMLKQYDVSLKETLPLFSELLSLPLPEGYQPLRSSPQRQKKETIEALNSLLIKEAYKEPLLFIIEDLHWSDPSTLEFLSFFVEKVHNSRIFALLTFRPQFTPTWETGRFLSSITLSRLTEKQVEEMVCYLARDETLSFELVKEIIDKTDGIPFFIEELTKMILESGIAKERADSSERLIEPPMDQVPSTLYGSLMSRLDRIAAAKELAQLGAVIGRSFTYELLQAVSELDKDTLEKELRSLVEAELLYKSGVFPDVTYIFKHALVQDAAYQSLIKRKRQQYHQRIAHVLEEDFPEKCENQPELLGHHYTEANLKEKAISFWLKAGQNAIKRSANIEAIRHLSKGLELVKSFPDSPDRRQKELALRVTIGSPLIAIKGYTAPEVEQSYSQSRDLCRQIGEFPQLFPALMGLHVFYYLRAEYDEALELAERLMRLARILKDPGLLTVAHIALGETFYSQGKFNYSFEHMEQGYVLYDSQRPRYPWLWTDPGVSCLSYQAWALWQLGKPDQALLKAQKAEALARDLSHPFSLAWALFFSALLHQFSGNIHKTSELSKELISLSSDQEFPFWSAFGTIMRGWSVVETEKIESGSAQILKGLKDLETIGSACGKSYWLGLLADVCGTLGMYKEGIEVIDEALEFVEISGEHWTEADLYRIRGELTIGISSDNYEESESYFRKALLVAESLGARSLELRATTSLCRSLQKRGEKEKARQMLAKTYGWFKEGLDTKDLRDARALLEELNVVSSTV